MTIKIDGTNGIVLPNGTAALPSTTGPDLDTGISYGDNTLRFSTGGVTAMTIDAGQNVTFNNSPTSGMRNRIINGDMQIDQRNGGAQITAANLINGAYMVDRWSYVSSQAAKFTAQQNAGAVTTAVGFPNYLGMTVATAVTVGASDYFSILQAIEGFNFADLAWGTASAKTVTLSFVVYSSLTGTFGGALRNSVATRSYPFTYSIPTANTWTTISVTIAGDTSGTWVGATNGIGVQVGFGLGVGSTFSGTAGAWSATNYVSATGATSVVGTSGATFYITGVQLEAGAVASSFERRMYGTELALCQRYYETNYNIWSGSTTLNYPNFVSCSYKVTKRTAATVVFNGIAAAGFPVTAPTIGVNDTQQFRADTTSNGTTISGYYQFGWAASAEL